MKKVLKELFSFVKFILFVLPKPGIIVAIVMLYFKGLVAIAIHNEWLWYTKDMNLFTRDDFTNFVWGWLLFLVIYFNFLELREDLKE